jgi:hypothetical protein
MIICGCFFVNIKSGELLKTNTRFLIPRASFPPHIKYGAGSVKPGMTNKGKRFLTHYIRVAYLLKRWKMEAFKIEKMGVSLIGEVVPLEARIIAVADSFDAMTSLRPHRRALPLEEVFAQLEKGKGKQFDSNIVEIFLNEKIYQ